jgi:hypothetical protein
MKLWKAALPMLALALVAQAPANAAEQSPAASSSWMDRMCSSTDDASKMSERMTDREDRFAERLRLNDMQKAAFKDWRDARAKLMTDHRTAFCANKPDLSSFEARLNFRQTMLENRLNDMKALEPKLVAFYNSLTDYQKGQFDARMGAQWRGHDRG